MAWYGMGAWSIITINNRTVSVIHCETVLYLLTHLIKSICHAVLKKYPRSHSIDFGNDQVRRIFSLAE